MKKFSVKKCEACGSKWTQHDGFPESCICKNEKLKLYGWYEDTSNTPTYTPPKICLFCVKPVVKEEMKCISLMGTNSNCSYFYWVHKICYRNASEGEILSYESSIIDNDPV